MTIKQEIEKINKDTEYIKETVEELQDMQDDDFTSKLWNIEDVKDFKYNDKEINFKSNIGKVTMNYSDAFEILWGTLDALGILTPEVEELLIYADKKHDLGKY